MSETRKDIQTAAAQIALPVALAIEDTSDGGTPISWKKESELYTCADRFFLYQSLGSPMRPSPTSFQDKRRAGIAKNLLLVALMSVRAGYGSALQQYQDSVGHTPPKAPLSGPHVLAHS